MKQKIVDAIRKKTRSEWRAALFDRWTAFRIWVQEHGERAALLGLFGGVLLVLAFKLVVLLLVVGLLAGYVIYFTALEERALGSGATPSGQTSDTPAP